MTRERLALGTLLLAALLLPAVVRSPYVLHVAVLAGIYVVLTLSLNLVTGFCGQFCAKADGAASDVAANATQVLSSERREISGVVVIRMTTTPNNAGLTDRQALPQPQHGRLCGAPPLS